MDSNHLPERIEIFSQENSSNDAASHATDFSALNPFQSHQEIDDSIQDYSCIPPQELIGYTCDSKVAACLMENDICLSFRSIWDDMHPRTKKFMEDLISFKAGLYNNGSPNDWDALSKAKQFIEQYCSGCTFWKREAGHLDQRGWRDAIVKRVIFDSETTTSIVRSIKNGNKQIKRKAEISEVVPTKTKAPPRLEKKTAVDPIVVPHGKKAESVCEPASYNRKEEAWSGLHYKVKYFPGDVQEHIHQYPESICEVVNGQLAIHLACTSADFPLAVLKSLVEASPESLTFQKARTYMTPLHFACMNSGASPEIVQYLISQNDQVLRYQNIMATPFGMLS